VPISQSSRASGSTPYKAKVRTPAVMLVSVIAIRITTYSQAIATMYTGVSERAGVAVGNGGGP
jgi:hypothetical protein